MGLLKNLLYRLRGEVTTEILLRRGLRIGLNFERNEKCIIDPSHCWLITIGDNVTLAPNVHILAHDASMKTIIGYTKIAPVTIGNNVFLGAGSIILPGVHIDNNVIVGAGSVVTHSVESNSVIAGNPAVKIYDYNDFILKHRQYLQLKPCYEEEYTLRNKNITVTMKNEA